MGVTRMGSKVRSKLTRVQWSLNALTKGIVRKHVVMIQAPLQNSLVSCCGSVFSRNRKCLLRLG